MLLSGQARYFLHRPHFDRSDARPWNPSRDADRFIEILGIDQEVACDLLARFDERTIGHEAFAVTDPNDGRCRRRMQRLSAQIFSVGVELVCELHGIVKHLLPLCLTEHAKRLFVVVNQQHVFHEDTSIDIG